MSKMRVTVYLEKDTAEEIKKFNDRTLRMPKSGFIELLLLNGLKRYREKPAEFWNVLEDKDKEIEKF